MNHIAEERSRATHDQTGDDGHDGDDRAGTPYWRFAAMIATAMVVMYVVMYLNTEEAGHVAFSQTRLYMTVLMGASMALIMLAFMTHMLTRTSVNVAIAAGSLVVFALSLWMVRTQALIGDSSYMRSMIPHHSIALLTSRNADIDDVRVRALADRIIEAQEREIAEMQWLLDDIDDNGIVDSDVEAHDRPLPDFGDG